MYAKIINDEVVKFPYTIHELKLDNPHTSFANNIETDFVTLAEFNIFMVLEGVKPEFDVLSEKVVKADIAKVNDKWIELWQILPLSEDEKNKLKDEKSFEVRAERNRLLAESDWTQFRDIDESISAKWVSYRQQLRDISLQEGFPFQVQFPSKPE